MVAKKTILILIIQIVKSFFLIGIMKVIKMI